MPKRLSQDAKQAMINEFKKGQTLEKLSLKYNLKKLTISKHLKNHYGENEFKRILRDEVKNLQKLDQELDKVVFNKDNEHDHSIEDYTFQEITPLNLNFEDQVRKDLTSEPLKESSIPENIFLIVDKDTELKVNTLRSFPEYSFLPENDQERKVIKVFSDKNTAKKFSSSSQKIIKVPNGKIFKLVSQFLLKRGITRIIFEDNLLSI